MEQTRAFSLLIIDDDSLIHQSFRLCLPAHWKPISATRADEIPDDRFFHAVFVDLHLTPGGRADGLDILRTLESRFPGSERVAMSGDVRRNLMEASLKAGAHRFLAKPLQREELLLVLDKIEALWDLRAPQVGPRPRWIGDGAASRRVLQTVASFRGEPGSVLIEGESGCGKEVAARLLHGQENLIRPFVSVNVGALPENLFESELFGHVKGAFTGADRDKPGLCETADGGDLFLDEIEALAPAMQVKLLRFLESGEFRRVGGRETSRFHGRVLAASNRPLEQMVKDGQFREDLFFRLAGRRLRLPPLRERPEDIADLAQHFIAAERPRRNKTLTDDGLERLKTYSWPGNVRELRRVCEQLCLISPLPLIRAEDVDPWVGAGRTAAVNLASSDLSAGLQTLVENYEKQLIRQALESEKDVEKAATLLKVSRSNLYRKIKDLGLETH